MPDLHPESLRAAKEAYWRARCPWLDGQQIALFAEDDTLQLGAAITAYLAAEAERVGQIDADAAMHRAILDRIAEEAGHD